MSYSAKRRKVKAKIESAGRIVRELKGMESAASNVLMSAAKEGGKIALNEAKKNCPVDSGALKESLKLAEGKKTETRADVKIDYDKKLRYATFVELGSRGQPGNPFMRNAVDDNLNEINDKIVSAISRAVK